jgi:hypothetical protein
MRKLIATASTLLVLGLAGCATTPAAGGYNEDLRKLAADCEARGGILVPTGQLSARPENDNVCRINDASRLTPGG